MEFILNKLCYKKYNSSLGLVNLEIKMYSDYSYSS